MRPNRLWPAFLATCVAAFVHGSVGVGVGGGGVAVAGRLSGAIWVSGGSEPDSKDYHKAAVRWAAMLWSTAVVECGDSYFAIRVSDAEDAMRLSWMRALRRLLTVVTSLRARSSHFRRVLPSPFIGVRPFLEDREDRCGQGCGAAQRGGARGAAGLPGGLATGPDSPSFSCL